MGDNLQDVSHVVVDEVSCQNHFSDRLIFPVRCTNGLWTAIFYCLS
jgi:hypothetical protein